MAAFVPLVKVKRNDAVVRPATDTLRCRRSKGQSVYPYEVPMLRALGENPYPARGVVPTPPCCATAGRDGRREVRCWSSACR